MTGIQQVAILTDGMGTYQARCLSCPYEGRWWRTQARAVRDAEAHTCEDAPQPCLDT